MARKRVGVSRCTKARGDPGRIRPQPRTRPAIHITARTNTSRTNTTLHTTARANTTRHTTARTHTTRFTAARAAAHPTGHTPSAATSSVPRSTA